MKNIKIILFILVLLPTFSIAQSQVNNWYFGKRSGIQFDNGSPVALTDGQMDTQAGCASISDKDGKLLFYTDGNSIWNKNHQIMVNGVDLNGSINSTQSAVIIPKPESNEIYYVFTVTETAGAEGLSYSEVDMSASNGSGKVTTLKNIQLHTPTCEKITAIIHENGTDIWVITHAWNSDAFLSYLITEAGVDQTPITSNTGTTITGNTSFTRGYMKASPNGKKIVVAHNFYNEVQLFDVSPLTGIVSNPLTLGDDYAGWGPYGVEFSPSSELLYVAEGSQKDIIQYDLNAVNIPESDTVIGTVIGSAGLGALQIGPDRKIYVAIYGSNYLGVINTPDSLGVNADFDQLGVDLLGGIVYQGLPTFIQSYFVVSDFEITNACLNDSAHFETLAASFDSLRWGFGDTSSEDLNTSTIAAPYHIYSDTGQYRISLKIYYNNVVDTSSQLIKIVDLHHAYGYTQDPHFCFYGYEIVASKLQDASYLWADSSTSSWINVSVEDEYIVEVTLGDCVLDDSLFIRECKTQLIMPNVFTPNDDGYNDLLVPAFMENIESMKVEILTRWGDVIYTTYDLGINWDGADVNDGTYFFRILYYDIEGLEYKKNGNFILRR